MKKVVRLGEKKVGMSQEKNSHNVTWNKCYVYEEKS